MLQLRPTFSESWYRVVALKPKLRATAQISRQYYRGERWYVVRDPAGNQFHRLSDAAYRFIGLLDGRRSVGEAWDLVGGQLADDAPTQPEVIQILSQEEVDPDVKGDLRLVDCEDSDIAEVTISAPLIARYKQTLNAFVEGAKTYCTRRGMNYLLARNDIPVDQLVSSYLRKRGLVR